MIIRKMLFVVACVLVALCCFGGRAQEVVVTPDDVSVCKSAGGNTEDNTRSCYETTIVSGETVLPDGTTIQVSSDCTAAPIFTGQVIPTIQFVDNQTLSGIFSPLFFSENDTYSANLLCRYNVQCPSDHLLYFQVIRQQIEGKTDGKCLDTLEVDRPALSSQLTTCGSEIEGFSDLELGRLDVQFLTNSAVEDCGFFVFAVCFNPERQNQPGCVNLPEDRRRKRRQRIRHIAVTTDGEVTYKDYTITVRRGGTVTNVIHGIRVLQTFRKPDQYLSFYGSSDETFPGTGIVLIGQGIAYYIIKGVDEKFLPSAAETQVITRLLNQLLPAFSTADLTAPGPDGTRTRTPTTSRRKRNFLPSPEDDESPEDYLTACNAVLQAVAHAEQERQLGYQFEV